MVLLVLQPARHIDLRWARVNTKRRLEMNPSDDVVSGASPLPRRAFLGVIGSVSTLALPIANVHAAGRTSPTKVAKTDSLVASLPWPERGGFAGQIIVGPHRSSAAAMLSKDKIFGLPREMSFIYGGVRDDKGNLIELVRNFPDWALPMPTLFVQDNTGKDTLHAVPEVMQTAASTVDYESEMVGDKAVFRSKRGAPGNACEVTVNADCSEVTWKEDKLLDLKGKLIGPGLQWHAPETSGSELYVSQIYHVKGQYQGRPVQGIIAFDQSYLPDGMHMYTGQDPLFREQLHHRCWYTWGTVYKDGSYDCGHFVLGTGRVGFAVYTDQTQKVTMVTDPRGDITIDSKGTWPSRIAVQAGKDHWEFLPDLRGRMPDMLGGAAQSWTPQNEGRWRKVGDKRQPEAWFAWGEIAPAGRTDYKRVYRS
jgi:hypothetical protein